jgi:hypothetical protein
MRIRSVKPEFWQSETISSVDAFSRLMAIALLNLSDDHGYFNASPTIVRGEVFPYEETLANVSRALASLVQIGYIRTGTTQAGKRVGNVVNFKEHQRVDHPSRLTFDVDSIIWDEKTNQSSRDPRETVASPRETLDQEHGAGSREHGAGSREIQPPIVPQSEKTPRSYPTESEVLEHCAKHFPAWHHSSVRDLYRHYVSTDWNDREGKKIKNWKNKFSMIHKFKAEKGTTGPTKEWADSQQSQQSANHFNERLALLKEAEEMNGR